MVDSLNPRRYPGGVGTKHTREAVARWEADRVADPLPVWIIAYQSGGDQSYRLVELPAVDEEAALDRFMAIKRQDGLGIWGPYGLLAVWRTTERRPLVWEGRSNDEPWESVGHIYRLEERPQRV